MRTIIAGSRTILRMAELEKAIEKASDMIQISEVVCGKAKGVDSLGMAWAMMNQVPINYFPADWKTFGKAAGYVRNKEMAEYADALIALWDGESKGTGHMIDIAGEKDLTIFVRILRRK